MLPARHRSGLVALALLLAASPAVALAQPLNYVEAVKNQKNGLAEVRALGLPSAFLDRIADRSLRADFRRKFRRVSPAPAVSSPDLPPASVAFDATPPGVFVEPAAALPPWAQSLQGRSPSIPQVRGYRAPAPLTGQPVDWPIDAPEGPTAEQIRRSAAFVARTLAHEGLLRTTMLVARRYPLSWTARRSLDLDTFRSVGIPTDLFDWFSIGGRPAADAIAEWLATDAPEDQINAFLARAVFLPRQACPGFVGCPDDGTAPVGAMRFQISAGSASRARSDGSEFDIIRQLGSLFPERKRLVSVEGSHVPETLAALAARQPGEKPPAHAAPARSQLHLIPTPAAPTPWAQDNGKVGSVPLPAPPAGTVPGAAAGRRTVTLLPRFASQNEQNTKFIPSDSLVFATLTTHLGDAVQSPLLFQGGNVICVVVPATGERLLLVGEAEVQRNRALGLTVEQALEAFRIEFGADRCVALPAVFVHIDLATVVRRRGESLVACLNDEVAASRLVAKAGLSALARAGVLPQAKADALARGLEEAALAAAPDGVENVWKALDPVSTARNQFAPGFTAAFVPSGAASAGGAESPAIPAASRFLLALDTLQAVAVKRDRAGTAASSPELDRYLDSLRRRHAECEALAATLQGLGMTVARIPGLGDEELAINPLNGLNLPDAYIMPEYGAPFQPLDAAAGQALAAAFGEEVRICPVRAASIQTRYGGVHCLTALYP